MAFPALWKQIQNELIPGIVISNWTAKKGYLGDIFTITAVAPDQITVESPAAKSPQVIPRKDFEAVDEVWKPYCAGSIQRQDIRDLTRFSKYIISIFHHVRSSQEEIR